MIMCVNVCQVWCGGVNHMAKIMPDVMHVVMYEVMGWHVMV